MIINLTEAPEISGMLGLRGNVATAHLNEQTVVLKFYTESIEHKRRFKELDLLTKLRHHPNIVSVIAAGPDIHNGILNFLVFDFAPEGDLYSLLHERKSVSYNLANAFSWMLQLTEALEHLHDECSPPIVHGDVKPANCLLFDGGARLKLCDFGSADSIQPEGGQSPTRRGTGGFMAPEIFTRPRELVKSSVSIGVECDVFAAGMTFWEILSRQHCWPQDEPFFVTLVQQVHKQRRPAPLDASLPAFLQPLLERCWSADPLQRPKIKEIRQFFKENEALISDDLVELVIPSSSPIGLAGDYDLDNKWEEEEAIDEGDSTHKHSCSELHNAEELHLLPDSSALPMEPCELSVVIGDGEVDAKR